MNLDKVQQELISKNLDGFIAYNTDRFFNEYIAESDKRIQFVTGFSGSWAIMVVLKHKAAIFVDGRYIKQAKSQVADARIAVLEYPKNRPTEWIVQNCNADDVIGYDPWLYTVAMADEIEKSLANHQIKFQACDNVIDAIWQGKPPIVEGFVYHHEEKFAGESFTSKLEKVREVIIANKAQYLLLTSLDSIAWLFNLRGSAIPYNPLFYSYAIIGLDDVYLYLDEKIEIENVKLNKLDAFVADMAFFKDKKIVMDLNYTTKAVASNYTNIIKASDPCQKLKSVKNEIELRGAKWAHIKEGVVFVKLFAWLEKKKNKKDITELDIVTKIEKLRREQENYKGPSFATICGVDANAGIIHYQPEEKTNKHLGGKIMLLDSGGQYLEGTTDMTRTISLDKKPTKEQKKCYTLVLKGHLAIARAEFPYGVRGFQLDTLARQFLWTEGLDYAHGTGHGVGSYLCVHESPPNISPSSANSVPLEIGMVTSNEPGCYGEDFGVRIENLIKVVKKGKKLGFDNLTLVPYDRTLIDKDLLSKQERRQVNEYHQTVLKSLKNYLEKDEIKWLKSICQEL